MTPSHPKTGERRVVLVCGPPGAGKTTYAHTLGLEVYDTDDGKWSGEREFRQALRTLARRSTAQAVVIRAGATRAARAKAGAMCRATETIVLDTDAETCIRRIASRKRPTARREIAAVADWWRKHEADMEAVPCPSSQDWWTRQFMHLCSMA